MSEPFYVLLYLCILFWQHTFEIGWLQSFFILSDNFLFYPLHLPYHGSSFSLPCSLPSNNLVNSVVSWSLCFLFIDVIDLSSSVHACAWCSVTESVTGKSYLRVVVVFFIFFSNRSELKRHWRLGGRWIGGWLQGYSQCGWQACLNGFKIAL